MAIQTDFDSLETTMTDRHSSSSVGAGVAHVLECPKCRAANSMITDRTRAHNPENYEQPGDFLAGGA